jgi:primosomal protein N' (replication factor Y) (superfamily II helicase)
MSFFIEVILPISLPQTFTYEVSEYEFNLLSVGMRVAVPFGKSKFYTGLVYRLHHEKPTLYEAKEIHQIIDKTPIVSEIQLKHWQWIATYYMCTIGEVYRSALPSALLLESETIITYKQNNTIDANNLNDDEYLLIEALQQQSTLNISEVMLILNKKSVFPSLQSLLNKNIISLEEEMIEEYKPKLVRYIKLTAGFSSNEKLESLLLLLKNAEKQKDLILSYFQLQAQERKPIGVKKLIEHSGATSSVVKALIDKEIFEEYYIQEDRISFSGAEKEKVILNNFQFKAFQEIELVFTEKEVCLLHGVTASGKTEVYIKIIEQFLKQEKQILYLLPEIALTTQLVSRLTQYFGNKVAVFHSKYSNNERVEVWNHVLNSSQNAQIVIGARSALFLPFTNLGFIVIDEEHEQTFKQTDPSPRYHARDAAIVLANFYRAKVLLGSATPSIETYFNAQNGKYGLVELHQRFGNAVLPEIQLVDLKENYFKKKMNGHFSFNLIEALTEALSRGEQIILFQNRRGYSPVIECITCGHVPQCPQCDVSLTYHKFKNQLRCHYCGHSMAKPNSCHACSSIDLTYKGFGTEQIELELATLFPTKNIKRMDQDTTRGKYSFERIIDSFKNREVDILVGTQMLAKGLDFENVSLVGILNADGMLYFPDFRAFERSFQLMTQVSGRAGRADKKGTVIIQTYNPDHNIIQQVTRNDYLSMFNEQLYERKIFQYPPYFKLIKLTLKHKDFQKLNEGSIWLYQVLKQQFEIPVLGPEEPAIGRIRNEYIRTILIKIPQEKSLSVTKKTIQKVLNSFEAISQYKPIKVGVNVDFY